MYCKKKEENENKIKEIMTRAGSRIITPQQQEEQKRNDKRISNQFHLFIFIFIQQAGVPTLYGPPGVLED